VEIKIKGGVSINKYIASLPEVITIQEVQKILRIGRSQAYELAKRKGFPKLPIDKPIRVPKREFLKWAGLDYVKEA
jgi:predicted DNA-binding transcriptional regulator AlpA